MPLHRAFSSAFVLSTIAFATVSAQQPPAPHGPAHGASIMDGLKKELIAGITEKDFMKLGDKPQSVKIKLAATLTDANYGMNFNGHFKGGATYTVPVGWTVEVEFINPGPVPHSAIVIDKADTKKLQAPEPYFKGAAVPDHILGMAFAKATFSFVADEPGEFALACGFPAHSVAGHWVCFNVSADAKAPSLQIGDAPAKEIK